MSREPRTPAPEVEDRPRHETRFRSLVEASPAAMFIVRGDEVLYANPAAEIVTGYRASELARTSFWEIFHTDHRDVVKSRALEGEALPRFLEVKLVTSSREERWVRYSSSIIDRKRSPAILATAVYLTADESRPGPPGLLDPEAQRLRKLESVEILAGGLAHDLNNLLTGILGSASLAAMKVPSDSSAAEQLERVLAAAGKAARLTKEMLGYAGTGRVRRVPTEIRSIAEKLVSGIRPSLGPRILLRVDLASGLPPIQADPTLLRHAVLNLLANSAEAMEDGRGEILVRAGTTSGAHPGASPSVFLEVHDDGTGMDEETRSRMFEPFFTTRLQASGVGLAAVLGIARSHGGSIQVESAPGGGTTVTLLFPAAVGPDAGERVRPAERGPGTILVVDDEDCNVARCILEDSGYEVLTAKDGETAAALFRQRAQEIDAVVLDVTLPNRNGARTLGALRRTRGDVRVVLASGQGPEVLGPELSRGCCGFIRKPFRARDLVHRIEEALARPS